jgi:hypothetical protein
MFPLQCFSLDLAPSHDFLTNNSFNAPFIPRTSSFYRTTTRSDRLSTSPPSSSLIVLTTNVPRHGIYPLDPENLTAFGQIKGARSPSRLPWPCLSSQTKISAIERLSTSSTPARHLLRSPKLQESLLFDSPQHQIPQVLPQIQLPHRTGSVSLPLSEEGSRRPRQFALASACTRYRPP